MSDAGGSIIGAMRAVFGADTAQLDTGLKSSQDKLAVFGDVAKASMAVVAAAVGAAAVAIGMSIQSAIDNADKVNKLAQSTGTTTEEFTKLSYAAQLADVSQESLGKSLGKLSKSMVSAASDGAGAAGQAFSQMGIAVRDSDGNLKSSSAVLTEVAGKFEGYRDGAAKTSLAIALFGKAGAEMIPLLNQGKQGLSDAADEAERFGLVLDSKTTAAAEAFNDNLKRLDLIKQGLATTMASKLLPSLETLSLSLLKSREESSLWGTIAGWLADQVAKLVTVGVTLITTWQEIFRTAANLKTAFGQLASMDFSGAWETMTKSGKDTVAAFSGLKDQIQKLWSPDDVDNAMSEMSMNVDAFLANMKKAGDSLKKDAPWNFSAADGQKALQSFLDGQAKRVAAMNAEAETVGMAAGALERLRVIKQGIEVVDQNKIARTPAVIASITAAGDAAAAAALKIQAANISQMVMSPAEKYAQDLAQLQVVYDKTSMTAETFALRQQMLAEGVGATWNQAGAGMASGFAQLATQFGKSSADMATAAKVFGIIEATINTYTAFTKALASAPPPFNYALAAGALAAGMAKVAAIKSQSIPTGMMTGGSMMVRGGGGPDSVPVNMMLSPGEQVDVWRPDQGGGADPRGGGASGGGAKTVVLQGFMWGRDQMTQLFEFLNEGMRDGHKLDLKFA